jgi:23S rRNA (adenine2503-C2)-methyltransferase
MKIIKNIKVPTGNIYIVKGQNGEMEMLSIGDYGKDTNLNQDKIVPSNIPTMPLTKKWVVTISTQYGCSIGCNFCDVPKVGPGKNISFHDLTRMILTAITQKGVPGYTERLNIHFARMGEPTWNPHVIDCGKWIHDHLGDSYNPHPVVSTMMPKNNSWLKLFIHTWMRLKNRVYKGNAGLQLSINSTNPIERDKMFNNNQCSIYDISKIMEGIIPVGRKITLNFAVANYTIDFKELSKLFPPELYIIKLTPMHKTITALKNSIKTEGDYTTPQPYKELEKRFQDVGYDTLVFIASLDEDLGRITCGNAILSGSSPECKHEVVV